MFFLVANKKKILTHKSTSSDIMINIASNISTDIMSEVITEGLQEIASECITSNITIDGMCLEPIVNFDEIYSINDFFYVKSDIVANIKKQRKNNKNI